MGFPKAIFLDFDGTLVDSEPLHCRCWLEAVRPWGGKTDWDDYRTRFVGITDREAGRILLSEAGHKATPELIREACDRKHAMYRSRCADELSIADDVKQCILELASKVPFGIVSTSITEEVSPVVSKAGLDSSISVLVCGDNVNRHKPDPEPYQQALASLKNGGNMLTPSDCLVFEDSQAGLAAARSAGMVCVRIGHPSELPVKLSREAHSLIETG